MFVEVPERNAVLHGHDDGVRTEQFRHVVGHGVYLMGFQGQYDNVLRPRFVIVVGRLHVFGHVLGPVFHDQFHAVFLDGFQVRSPYYEGHVFTG